MIKRIKSIDAVQDKRVVLLQSGGMDSCVLACVLHKLGYEIHHLFIHYGQNSETEEKAAVHRIISAYGGKLHEVTLNIPWWTNSAIVGGKEVECFDVQGDLASVQTNIYVAMRNQVFLSIAASLAESLNIKYIAAGLDGRQNIFGHVTSGTPDKHRAYVKKFERSITEGSVIKHVNHDRFELIVPIVDNEKEDTIKLGMKFNCDFTLSWTCYNSGDIPCGECAACVDRIRHFKNLGMVDPIVYKNNSLNTLD